MPSTDHETSKNSFILYMRFIFTIFSLTTGVIYLLYTNTYITPRQSYLRLYDTNFCINQVIPIITFIWNKARSAVLNPLERKTFITCTYATLCWFNAGDSRAYTVFLFSCIYKHVLCCDCGITLSTDVHGVQTCLLWTCWINTFFIIAFLHLQFTS